MKEYRPGDKVRSTTLGFYFGIPGRIVMQARATSDNDIKSYLVRMENEKTVIIGADHLELIEED